MVIGTGCRGSELTTVVVIGTDCRGNELTTVVVIGTDCRGMKQPKTSDMEHVCIGNNAILICFNYTYFIYPQSTCHQMVRL